VSSDDEGHKKSNSVDIQNDMNYVTNITDDMPVELQTLIHARNALNMDIYEQKLVVDKANEKLNEDLFNKRCEEQNKRKLEQKYREGISILLSDKNTYLKMRSQIKKGSLDESNISLLFTHKYHILKFMENKHLLEFSKTASVDSEYAIFKQLQKVTLIHEDEDEDNKEDMIDDLDTEYIGLCMEYMDILESYDGMITTDKKIHEILNENPEIKKVLFREAANTDVFDKDTDKEHYEKLERKRK
jgi:hypothetical protein